LPTALTSGAEVDAVTDTGMTLNFIRGEGSGVLLLVRRGSPVTALPTAGQNYNANALFGLGDDLGDSTFVLAATAVSSIQIGGLQPNERYCFAWFDYNGDGAIRSYVNSASETLEQHTYLRLQLRVLLEGPFAVAGDSMKRQLGNLIPDQQPFNQPPWQYQGNESRAMAADGLVDWVYVQLRQSSTSAAAVTNSVVFEQACLLRSDGWLMNMDGDTAFLAPISRAGQQFAVVFPRTHLPVLAANALQFNGQAHAYDFSTAQSQTLGTGGVKEVAPDRWVLVAGDVGASKDYEVDLADVAAIWQARNQVGIYARADLNLDGHIDASDRSLAWNNRGRSSTLPE
jgi:hypothetical protein